jgi:hypothetical protein
MIAFDSFYRQAVSALTAAVFHNFFLLASAVFAVGAIF